MRHELLRVVVKLLRYLVARCPDPGDGRIILRLHRGLTVVPGAFYLSPAL